MRWVVLFSLALPGCQHLTVTDSVAEVVGPVTEELRSELELDRFYQQYSDVQGFPVLASARVQPASLAEARYLILKMVGHRPELLSAMAANKTRFTVMAHDEWTTDVPEHSDLRPPEYWDRRARGLGATRSRPSVSCGEENLLAMKGDPYSTENILIHEFAHAIHEMGLSTVDPTFDSRLEDAYRSAIDAGLWKGAYASTNRMEYWAEAVQCWFDTNRENDNQHNHVDTRIELKQYDPPVSELCREVFGDGHWKYIHPSARSEESHLRGIDWDQLPEFHWAEGMEEAYKAHPKPE
ncbi:MAG TPA: hypothetical protein EYQ08_01275 [Planctomycetes bacterium]|nr:hypothetical protein [Planctomycetota bacterium]